MEGKFKFRLGAPGMAGLIFAFAGLPFLLIGILMPADSIKVSQVGFRLALCGMGGLFFVLGNVFLVQAIRKNVKYKKLVAAGNYLMADFVNATLNTSVSINGRNPYIAEFQFMDSLGMIHVFQSRDLMFDPTSAFSGRQVRVYVDPENFDNYYVDVDEILTVH